jgi:hypothetical protein
MTATSLALPLPFFFPLFLPPFLPPFLPSFLLLSLSPFLPPLPCYLPPSLPLLQISFASCSKLNLLTFNSLGQGGYVSGVGVGGNVASVAGAPGIIGGAGYVKLRFLADNDYAGKVFSPSCFFMLTSSFPFFLLYFLTFLLFYFPTFPIHPLSQIFLYFN